MALNANQLTVKQSEAAADTIAAAIWDIVAAMDVTNARDASTRRMLRKHAQEIVDLHDTLDPGVVLHTPPEVQGNGHVPTYEQAHQG